ncbi:pyruvate dehydrogenase complex dihydrolipoyllysine-residue acetyltransferase [Saccharobesus litoralis]|uniref:Acetyltransferase component of pyruvate dehydrogenase complex n=1 Tax=Saccharobesus litoralis TaxID=2172099 RepID=A0A2S0VWW8_9ALTE|nr:pyruvate dehydrogenase complex dihydrolipoyllysine-residue acetyltransferase [Saccharobesus litoralis]AWB68708.1 pyruvate dehydrogenase complex dihydrolipoyllysine-residue acetyltransferase [Saccharobesus litoralis]
MMAIKDVLVPDVGGDEVEVIELCVAAGDTVEAEDSLITVESDKASMDIPAPFAGTVKEIKVAVGDKVSEGTLIVTVEDASGAEEAPAAQAPAAEAPAAEAAPAPAAAPAASATIEVTVPDIGGDTDVEVIEVLVAVGDEVSAEDGLITLETDKATMDVPCPADGVVKELKIAVGDKASEGTLVCILETAGGAAEAPAAQAPTAQAPAVEAAPAAAAPAAASELVDIAVPDIGEDGEVDVIEVLVAVGDEIAEEDGLITLETDKATMDVPSSHAGVVKEVYVSTGDKVKKGSLVVKVEAKGAAPAAAPAPAASAPAPAAQAPSAAPAKPAPTANVEPAKPSKNVHASPSVRRTAREFGVDLSLVPATGRKGRILKEDVQNWVKAELAKPKAAAGSASGPIPENVLEIVPVKPVDHSKFGEIEVKELGRIQKISGPFLHRNWATIPHVTQFDEADITELEAFRKEQNAYHAKKQTGLKITPLVFVMKAVAKALEKFPNFNSSLSDDGNSLILKKFINIGIAVATPGGLVVPVIKDVNKKGIEELSEELIVTSKKARDGKLKAADMQGGTFTISSLGGIGGTAFTPIVNAPEVGILGVSKSDFKPKWNGKEFEPRLMVPLSLSYDHRVIDGAEGAAFSTEIANNLTDLRRLVL